MVQCCAITFWDADSSLSEMSHCVMNRRTDNSICTDPTLQYPAEEANYASLKRITTVKISTISRSCPDSSNSRRSDTSFQLILLIESLYIHTYKAALNFFLFCNYFSMLREDI